MKQLKVIKEEYATYTPEKAKELIDKYEKEFDTYRSQAERLYNVMDGFTIGDLLEDRGEDKLKKIHDAAYKLHDKANKLWNLLSDDIGADMSDQDERELSDKAREIGEKYNELYKFLYELQDFANKLADVKEDFGEDELKTLTNYKK